MEVIILAPPWGGVDYNCDGIDFNLHTSISVGDGFDLVELSLKICDHIVYLVPKNTPKRQFEEMSAKFNVYCGVEDIFLHGKCKMTIAYIGPKFRSVKVKPPAKCEIVATKQINPIEVEEVLKVSNDL